MNDKISSYSLLLHEFMLFEYELERSVEDASGALVGIVVQNELVAIARSEH